MRSYRLCAHCELIYVPPTERPDVLAEKAQYDLHDNNPDDPDYRQFLSRLTEPLLDKLSPGSIGLDFGSGPGPLLATMFREAGMRMRTYDVFYDPDASVWYQTYDFITCTEVIEHLHSPGRELDRLFTALKPGGWLGIMTQRFTPRVVFTDWKYIRDITHVCFFSDTSLKWLASRHNAELLLLSDDVALLQKRAVTD